MLTIFWVGLLANRNGATDWDGDMKRAKAVGIDAFALNIGTDDYTDQQLQYAYESAEKNGVKCFISFDFNWWSTGSAQAVGAMAKKYDSYPAQLMVDGKTFVSTFVGDGLDVAAVRAAAGNIYFAPNFRPLHGTSLATVDCAFNWMGWPNNGHNRAPDAGQKGNVEAGDQEYISALAGKDYMAPVSPWFFTHYGKEVSYSKNWVFPGDSLWFDRWSQLLETESRFIEIVSWNDYGESHYVGPLDSPHSDDGASKWINDMPHDGWLDMAKPFIAAYKAGAKSVNEYITSDQLIYWYRPQPKTVNCDATDTCMAGAEGENYYIGKPNGWNTMADSVFVVALLKSAGTVQITSGESKNSFEAPAGASIHVATMGTGKQTFALTRGEQNVLSGTSAKDIINGCVCGLYNFNAYVGSLPPGTSPALAATGLTNFAEGLKVSTCAASPSLAVVGPGATPAPDTPGIELTTVGSLTITTRTTIVPARPDQGSTPPVPDQVATPPAVTTPPAPDQIAASESVTTTTTTTRVMPRPSNRPYPPPGAAPPVSAVPDVPDVPELPAAPTSPIVEAVDSTVPVISEQPTVTDALLSTGEIASATMPEQPNATQSTPVMTEGLATAVPSEPLEAEPTMAPATTVLESTSRFLMQTPTTQANSSPTESAIIDNSTMPSSGPMLRPPPGLNYSSAANTSSPISDSGSVAPYPNTTMSSTPAENSTCNAGTGHGNYAGLCLFACQYGYCPAPCTCTRFGEIPGEPPLLGQKCVQADGLDESYSGLCAFACDRGYVPTAACKLV